MIVLGIEGALGGFSAAVAVDGRIVAAKEGNGNIALEAGLGLVAEVLAGAGVRGREVDRLAVGIGPGGFTGLRITIAYAKSLAQAWNVPLVPISSFDTLEYGLDLVDEALTIVVGRPGIISARYRCAGEERRASGPIAEVLQAVRPPHDRRVTIVNAPEDVLAACAEAAFNVEARTPSMTPRAAAVALAGIRAHVAANAHEVRADYGELPAAKVPVFAKAPKPA